MILDLINHNIIRCLICNQDVSKIVIDDGKSHFHRERLEKHLKEVHDMSLTDYFKHLGGKLPLCKCGCGKPLSISYRGRKLKFGSYIRYHVDPTLPKNQEQYRQMAHKRKGEGNPMFGKCAWNRGLTANTNIQLHKLSVKMTGRKISDETRMKQSISAHNRKIHGHSGKHHNCHTKKILSEITLKMIHDGKFAQTKTRPHLQMRNILIELGIEFEEEKKVSYFSFDFYLKKFDIYIEVDGDYFHSNPLYYPHGPHTKTQKINFYRDLKKNSFCDENNLHLLRFWEHDIMNNSAQVKTIIAQEVRSE